LKRLMNATFEYMHILWRHFCLKQLTAKHCLVSAM
jgi:hypothetical protein